MDCLFCKISAGSIPADVVYQDEQLLAFKDIHPQAPQHILIIPRKHIPTLNQLTPQDGPLLAEMILTAKKLAKQMGLAEDGYRLVMNCNKNGGQIIFHLHLHLLGGRALTWPPG
jgi:histidine triad (HIT) family protein